MDLTQVLAFALISIAFIVVPGPNVLVIVSTSLDAGKLRGLQTVAGTSLAMALQLLIAAFGTSWLLSLLSEGLFWLKWVGVIYLVFLGLRSIRRAFLAIDAEVPNALGSFQRGFWISLTNPKTIFFFSAFLPQFVTGNGDYLQQILILSLVFWLLAVLIDASYALLAASAGKIIKGRISAPLKNGATGALYLGASFLLTNSNKA